MSGDTRAPASESIDKDLFSIALKQDELADKLGKWIPRGTNMLLEGEIGSGRSVLCQRMCYGFLFNGHSATYVSTEQTIKGFIDQMWSLDYKVSKYLQNGALTFFPVYPLIGNTVTRADFIEKLTTSPALYTHDVLIIDSLSTLTQNRLDENSAVKLMAFLKKMNKLGKSVIMTVEANTPGVDTLRLSTDVYMTLTMKATGQGINRVINVKRFMRARKTVTEIIRFRIEPKIGMIIEITEVSG
ncbi:MAG TPA: ATPase domain-containing protein [Methanomassiliicoccales archaeon]|jgi:flagellar protein FlaH